MVGGNFHIVEAIQDAHFPPELERISIIEWQPERAIALSTKLQILTAQGILILNEHGVMRVRVER